MSIHLRSFVLRTLALALLAMPSFAANLPVKGYSMRVWQTEDGLPQNGVTSLTQTRDGYLWIATYGGVARFDGAQFQSFEPRNTPAIKDRVASRLFEDALGRLWIGHGSATLTRYANGRFETIPLAHAGEHEGIRAIGSDEHGHLWAVRDGGAIDALEGDTRIPPLKPGEPAVNFSWARLPSGRIWVVHNGAVGQLVDGKLVPVHFDVSRGWPLYVLSLAASSDGGLWVLGEDRIRKWKEGQWTGEAHPFPPDSTTCALELHDGTLAVGTAGSGLYLYFRDGRPPIVFTQQNGLPQNWVRCLFEDYEGTLWLGSGSGGLVAIRSTAFSVVDPPDHWQGRSVLSVTEGKDRSLWVGTEGAGLYCRSNDTWTRYGMEQGLDNPFIWAVAEDSVGRVWAGSWNGGPYRLGAGRFIREDVAAQLQGPIQAIWANPESDELLVGARNGLLQHKEGRWEWILKTPGAFADSVSAIVRARDGSTWLGLSKAGLGQWKDGILTTHTPLQGLIGDIYCLFADEDGALWIGVADGLARLKDGRISRIGTAQGLIGSVVGHILADDHGFIWLSSNRGLQRVGRKELNLCADGVLPTLVGHVYDRNDGLPTAEFTAGLQAAACKSADGTLWFTSTKGLVNIDPRRIEISATPPRMAFEALLVDGATTAVSEQRVAAELSPHHQRLEFRYTALSFIAPEKVRFKYRLDGLDTGWVEAGPKRVAFYSQLPAGHYRFHAIACNNDGVWNNEGISIAFTVAPFFWQTWWFVGMVVLAVLTAVALLARFFTRRRMQRQIEEMERRHVVERERTRIAQDIHDDVGASLSRIAMLSQPAHSQLTEPQRAAAVLSRIYSTAREVTRALDEIVWAVDPAHDTLDSLVDYMGRFAQGLLASANLRCRLDLPVEVPPWPLPSEIRHNLFLAFKEALNNAVKHAAATEVRISLSLQPDSFVLSVRDNGRGLAAEPAGSRSTDRVNTGNGVRNMEARLARMGGRFELSSQSGEGTNVSFVVPVPAASAVTRSGLQ